MKPQLAKQYQCRLSDNDYMRVMLSFTGLLAPKCIEHNSELLVQSAPMVQARRVTTSTATQDLELQLKS